MGAPVVRFEIGCKDKEKTSVFYETVFGWSLTPSGVTSEIDTKAGKGIKGALTALGHEPHQYVLFYMEVESADKTCAEIKAKGGEVVIGPVDIPGGIGRFAWFKDPEGNLLGVFEAPKS